MSPPNPKGGWIPNSNLIGNRLQQSAVQPSIYACTKATNYDKDKTEQNMGKGKLKAKVDKDKDRDNIIEENSSIRTNSSFSRIPEEILLEILSRLPPKVVFNIRSVSKSINKLTRTSEFTTKHSLNYCKALSGNVTGFFCQCRGFRHLWDDRPLNEYKWITAEYLADPEFILLEPEPNPVPDPSLKLLKQKGKNSNEVVEIIDSCNGLLFCCIYNGKKIVQTYFVCNPFTKESVSLPFPPRNTSILSRFSFALLADTTSKGYLQYKVFCVFKPRGGGDVEPYSVLLIFSSETGKWEEIDERLPPLIYENNMIGVKMVLNGRLFMNCLEDHILVCHLINNKRCYELIEAPCSRSLGRSLWKSKDEKLFCYYHGFDDTVSVWSLCGNDENELKEWKLEHNKEIEMLTEDVLCQVNGAKKWNINRMREILKPRVAFKIIASKPESNVIYLWKGLLLLKYDVKERNFEKVWGFERGTGPTTSCVFPYVHSFAPIQIAQMKEDEKEVERSMNGLGVKDYYEEELQGSWAKKRNNRKTRRKNAALHPD